MIKLNMFFYGSLISYPPWKDAVADSKAATVVGKLHLFNRFYPAAVMEGEDTIKGRVVSYEFLDKAERRYFFADLDQFEGCVPNKPDRSSYHRLMVEATTEDGDSVVCWIYISNPTGPYANQILDMDTVIPSGDWLAWRKETQGW